MIWLELRSNNSIYRDGWNFSESVWAPTLTSDGKQWPFWTSVGRVVKGDIIFHLREEENIKRFVGYSTALTDGYLTTQLPADGINGAAAFYKAELTDFRELQPPVLLSDYFGVHDELLRQLFTRNQQERLGRRLFYVIQNMRLQCLNGAYFSEFDEELSLLLIQNYNETRNQNQLLENIRTGVTPSEVATRIGQQEFSKNVKANYNYRCCFPNCNVEGNDFLASGHIARWADNIALRGHTGNGLCFCPIHDKAFEKGFFTINESYKVVLIEDKIVHRPWLDHLLRNGENLEIKHRSINPLLEAIYEHWQRIGYNG